MPTYTYQCTKCEFVFEEFHLMSETVESCKKCDSPVRRVLSSDFFVSKTSVSNKEKPGSLVRQYIEDVKEEVKREKKSLSTKEYVVND